MKSVTYSDNTVQDSVFLNNENTLISLARSFLTKDNYDVESSCYYYDQLSKITDKYQTEYYDVLHLKNEFESDKKGFELLVKLDCNDSGVALRLARCYRNGWGTGIDLDKSINCYNKIIGTHKDLILEYCDTLLNTCDCEKAKIAAEYLKALENPFAKRRLAEMYRYGLGVEKDISKANELYLEIGKGPINKSITPPHHYSDDDPANKNVNEEAFLSFLEDTSLPSLSTSNEYNRYLISSYYSFNSNNYDLNKANSMAYGSGAWIKYKQLEIQSRNAHNYNIADFRGRINLRKIEDKSKLAIIYTNEFDFEYFIDVFPITHFFVVGIYGIRKNVYAQVPLLTIDNNVIADKYVIVDFNNTNECLNELVKKGIDANKIITMKYFDDPSFNQGLEPLMCSFGPCNPEKTIVSTYTHGQFLFFINKLYPIFRYCKINNYELNIDMCNYPNALLNQYLRGMFNPWDCFFEQPCHRSLEEVYNSKNVLLLQSSRNPGVASLDWTDPIVPYIMFKEYIHFTKEYQTYLDLVKLQYYRGKYTIGVISRGTDYFSPKTMYESVPYSSMELISLIDDQMETRSFNVYVSTEDQDNYNDFLKRYGDCLMALPQDRHARDTTVNNFTTNDEGNLLNKLVTANNYLTTTMLVSYADEIIANRCSAASFVDVMLNHTKKIQIASKNPNKKNGLFSICVESHNKNHLNLNNEAPIMLHSNLIRYCDNNVDLLKGKKYTIHTDVSFDSLIIVLYADDNKYVIRKGTTFIAPFDCSKCDILIDSVFSNSYRQIQIEEGSKKTNIEKYRFDTTIISVEDINHEVIDGSKLKVLDLRSGTYYTNEEKGILDENCLNNLRKIIRYENGYLKVYDFGRTSTIDIVE